MVFVGRPDAQRGRCCLAGVSTNGDQDAKSSFHYSRRVGDCRVGGANGDSIRASHAWDRAYDRLMEPSYVAPQMRNGYGGDRGLSKPAPDQT